MWSSSSFVTGMGEGGPIAMSFGPHAGGSSLYYTTFSGGGEVRRVTYTASTNRTPSAQVRATPASGPTPLGVSFDGSGSSDPDPGDTLTYLWEWGDGSLGTQTSTPITSHVYTRAGSFTATLRVRDGRGALSDPVTVTVDAGNQPPTASIDAPSTDLRFRVGQALTLSATASDPEDGPLPASSMRWEVLRRHDKHTHPFLGPVSGDDIPFTAPAPEDLAAAASSSLEARLIVTDSAGATTTVTRAILPNDVELTFATQPTGLELEVGDLRRPGPFAVTAWEGQVVPVGASAQTGASGTSYAFAAWSDGGGARHDLIAPGEDAAYTATFTAQGGPPAPSGTGLTGEYFDNKDLTALKLTRLDPLSPSPGAAARPPRASAWTPSRCAGAGRSSPATPRATASPRLPTTACGCGSTVCG